MIKNLKFYLKTTGLVSLILLISTSVSWAADKNISYDLVDSYFNTAMKWAGALESTVIDLFVLCFTLEIVMLGLTALIKRSSIEDILGQMVMALLFGAFILACIMNYAEWSRAITEGLSRIANIVSSDSAKMVTNPLDKGFEVFTYVLLQMRPYHPMDSLGYLLIGLAILICFAMITIQIIYIKCEAFVAIGASFILLGFGGCHFFKDYAINLMRYILSVGFKLYILYVVLGLGFTVLEQNLTPRNYQPEFAYLGMILVSTMILYALTKALPDVVAGILQGSHIGSGQNMSNTVMQAAKLTAGAAIALKTGGVGAAGFANNAVKAGAAAKTGGASGIGGIVKGAAQNMWNSHQQVKNESPQASTNRKVGSKIEALRQMHMLNNQKMNASDD